MSLWKGSGDRASPACHSFEFETKDLHFSSLIGFQPCDLVIPPGFVTWAFKKYLSSKCEKLAQSRAALGVQFFLLGLIPQQCP